MTIAITVLLPVILCVWTGGCDAGDHSTEYMEVVTALKSVSHALECLGNIAQDSLTLQRGNSDAFQGFSKIQTESRDYLSALKDLPGLVSSVHNRLGVQQENRNSIGNTVTDFIQAEKRLQGREGLEEQLANEVRKVAQLQDSLLAMTTERDQNTLKVQALEGQLEELRASAYKLREEATHLNETVETLMMAGECRLCRGKNIRKQVQRYNIDKNWEVMRRSVEVTLDSDSAAYKQLQQVSYNFNASLWQVGERGYMEIAAMLVLCGGAVNIVDKHGDTILFGAVESNNVKMAAWLVDNGADMEAFSRTGWTPVTYAAYLGHVEMVQLLVQAGASTTSKTTSGVTALETARNRGHIAVQEYLSQLPH